MEKGWTSILKLPMQKLIIAHIEANKDGKPHYYQHVKLKYCLHKKGYIIIMWLKLSSPLWNVSIRTMARQHQKQARQLPVFIWRREVVPCFTSVDFLTVMFGWFNRNNPIRYSACRLPKSLSLLQRDRYFQWCNIQGR